MRGKNAPEDEVVLQIGERHAPVLPARGARRKPKDARLPGWDRYRRCV
jgi:hypothetical protein